jgi:hypothetical protein
MIAIGTGGPLSNYSTGDNAKIIFNVYPNLIFSEHKATKV